MGKRSDFKRVERDYYKTPMEAVKPLAPFLPAHFEFYEPCAGDGRLTDHLCKLGGTCVGESDIEPDAKRVTNQDALTLTEDQIAGAMIITNPPWGRRKVDGYIFHRLIEHFITLTDTVWLLADADWMHTWQAQDYIAEYLSRIVSIGRVKWMEGTSMTGKDNCCWYQFSESARACTPAPIFYGRGIAPRNPPTNSLVFV